MRCNFNRIIIQSYTRTVLLFNTCPDRCNMTLASTSFVCFILYRNAMHRFHNLHYISSMQTTLCATELLITGTSGEITHNGCITLYDRWRVESVFIIKVSTVMRCILQYHCSFNQCVMICQLDLCSLHSICCLFFVSNVNCGLS